MALNSPLPTATQARLRAILEARKSAQNSSEGFQDSTKLTAPASGLVSDPYQNRAVELASKLQSFVLTGPAGSGKSTTIKRIIQAIRDTGIAPIGVTDHKHLRTGTPGIVVTSFTNRAVDNDKAILPADLAQNCLTAHKLLEFEPVYFVNEKGKDSMSFEPKRTAENPLPSSIHTLVIEEATLMNVPLWNMLSDALPYLKQLIIVGDIQQLPPVFGKSIFIHAMQKGMETVELKNVYRTADGSPILELAHRIISGTPIPPAELKDWNITRDSGTIQIVQWPKQASDIAALTQMRTWIPKQIDSGSYNPEVDMILTPFNKGFGTIELNKIVAQHLAKTKNAEVWEIFTGVTKKYLRIGEKVVYSKQDAYVINIEPNKSYYGKPTRLPSTTMDYSGMESEPLKHSTSDLLEDSTAADFDIVDRMFEQMGTHTEDGESVARAASHIITLEIVSTQQELRISTTGELNNLDLNYVMTVHKSQGSEWGKVLLLHHHTHAPLIFRELVYTAITRARKNLVIICEPNLFLKGINVQRLRGTSIEEKIESFESWLKTQTRSGKGNVDEIPKRLGRFKLKETLEESKE